MRDVVVELSHSSSARSSRPVIQAALPDNSLPDQGRAARAAGLGTACRSAPGGPTGAGHVVRSVRLFGGQIGTIRVGSLPFSAKDRRGGGTARVTTLGVNVSGDCAYLAVVSEGQVVDAPPYSLRAPQGLGEGEQLLALKDDIRGIIGLHSIDKVRVVEPESNYEGKYVSFTERFTLEVCFVLAGIESGVDSKRLSRPTVRSLLGVSSGRLPELLTNYLEKSDPYWNGNKRGVAALAAFAAEKE